MEQQQFLPITLINKDEHVTNCRYYPVKGSKKGVILVGGIGGNFDSPAKNLYPKLAIKLSQEGINALRVQFRYPTDLEESVQDVLVGAEFLNSEGVLALGLVGHSFGGVVVIQASTKLDTAKAVVTLATQSYGGDVVADLPAHTSIMLIHGSDDETLSPQNSSRLYDIAREPKELHILEGNGHGLVESADEVFRLVYSWLIKKLEI